MPIYEYRCKGCEKVFEYMQRMSEDPKTTCEECAGSLERLISASAFHLKGGGWYKDLYSSPKKDSGSGASNGASESKDSGSAKSSDSGGGSDTKSAAAATPAKSSAAGD